MGEEGIGVVAATEVEEGADGETMLLKKSFSIAGSSGGSVPGSMHYVLMIPITHRQ